MKKFMLAALVVGGIAQGVPAAYASRCTHPGPPPEIHPPDCAGYAGGCSFASVSDPTPNGDLGGQGVYTGEIDWQVVLYDAVNPANNPVSATVSCELQVNGTVQAGTPPTNVTLAGAGGGVIQYTAPNETDVVELCTVVTDYSNGLPDSRDCGTATTTTIPPEEVNDLIADTTKPLDSIICGALKAENAGPTAVNALTGVTGIYMDEDDCDIWGQAGRIIDFDPYED